MNCNAPFSDFISNCTDAVMVNAGLVPATRYNWIISDKFNKKYSGVITTDANGNFEIPVVDLPDGLLNSYGGEFSLEVNELYSCGPVQLNMKAAYDKIFFTVAGGTMVKENLGC